MGANHLLYTRKMKYIKWKCKKKKILYNIGTFTFLSSTMAYINVKK